MFQMIVECISDFAPASLPAREHCYAVAFSDGKPVSTFPENAPMHRTIFHPTGAMRNPRS
jgi:hypothetical protein